VGASPEEGDSMSYEWTKEEIMLTRRAWRMVDNESERKLIVVSWAVSLATVAFIVWVLL
jgi:hypothetical protein